MRYTLGIDTATGEGSVGLAGDGAALGCERLHPGEHSSGLSSAVHRLLDRQGISLERLAALVVSKGPGSFTGLRIGLAWAKGVAFGIDLPLILVGAHEAAAHAHRARSPLLATLIPAERAHVEAVLWSGGDRAALRWGPENIVEDDDLFPRLADEAGGGPLAIAPSTPKLEAALRELLEDGPEAIRSAVTVLSGESLGPAVAEVGDRAFLEGKRDDLASASPAYGRAPNARKPR